MPTRYEGTLYAVRNLFHKKIIFLGNLLILFILLPCACRTLCTHSNVSLVLVFLCLIANIVPRKRKWSEDEISYAVSAYQLNIIVEVLCKRKFPNSFDIDKCFIMQHKNTMVEE